ncbi:sugar phosphate nucleotidyltransferase [Peribacillus sp. NPDC097206]|uniref:sugar phosphate nucleotidyltransferase n=1 Tax=unclassified Peribacillus TaxID=2675266 RepID=UPI0038020F7D
MRLILLSGGSGKRLWPLSNSSRSKQFLRLLPSEQKTNSKVSMIQRVWNQLENVNLADRTIISTNKSQVDMIISQLGNDVPLIMEPSRRDTYPAIVLASLYLYSVESVDPEEVVGVMPVDPFAGDEFFEHMITLEKVLQQSMADLALVGIAPTYPSEKYGYIVPIASQNTKHEEAFQRVSYFTEKPNHDKAKQLIKEGALWNGGIFAFKLGFLLNYIKTQGLPLSYAEVFNQFNRLPKNSFDYEVVEKSNNIIVVPYNGEWKDLGTWNTLTEEMKTPIVGKGSIGPDCRNVHVINELDIPVSVLGVSDLVVVVSPDGILVTDKEASQRVKEISLQIEERPMYEERRWGWYHVLDYTKFDEANEVLTKRIGITANKNISYQRHFHRSEVWTIINGTGLFVLNDIIRVVNPGDVLEIPLGAAHGIKALTDLEIIEVQCGTELIEEDILRIFMTWEEVEANCTHLEKE